MDDFKFPHQPYKVQSDFMNALYDVFDKKQIGVFESPTGTGKTLSIICGAMKYLKDHEDLALSDDDDNSSGAANGGESGKQQAPQLDWIAAHYAKKLADARAEKLRKRNEQRRVERAKLAALREEDRRIAAKQQSQSQSQTAKRTRNVDDADALLDEQDFVLNAFDDGDDDTTSTSAVSTNHSSSSLSSSQLSKAAAQAVEALLRSQSHTSNSTNDARSLQRDAASTNDASITDAATAATTTEDFQERKLFYCARTHSQLSQFIAELRKTEWAADVRVVPLGARTSLCIHSGVRALRDATLISDRCDELRRHPPGSGGCPYLADASRATTVRERILAAPGSALVKSLR